MTTRPVATDGFDADEMQVGDVVAGRGDLDGRGFRVRWPPGPKLCARSVYSPGASAVDDERAVGADLAAADHVEAEPAGRRSP